MILEKSSLNELAKNKKYGLLRQRLNDLVENSPNSEIRTKAKKALELLDKISASVVAEDDEGEDINSLLDNLTKSLDSLLLSGGEGPQDKINDANAQSSMKNIFNELYKTLQPQAKISEASNFLQKAAALSDNKKTLAYNELSTAWSNIAAGLKIVDSFPYNNENFRNSVKFLFGCLILKYTLKSNIFGGEGVKKLDDVTQDESVSREIKKFSADLTIDKSIIDNFPGYDSASLFISGLNEFFEKLDEKAKSFKAEQKAKAKESSNNSADNLNPEKAKEEAEKSSDDEKAAEKEIKDVEDTKSSEVIDAAKNGERFSLSDSPEAFNRKIANIFGSDDTNGSLLDKYIRMVNEIQPKKTEEPVKEDIYDIVNEARLGTYLKNKLGNIGRVDKEKSADSIQKSLETTIQDMENYKSDFLIKATKLAETALSKTNSIREREKAVRDLNILKSRYVEKLRECLVHAQRRNRLSELGLMKKDAKEDINNLKNKAKTAYQNSSFGQTKAYQSELDDKTISNFDKIWDSLDSADKKNLAYAVTSGNLQTLYFKNSILNSLDGNGRASTENLADKLKEVSAKNDFVINDNVNNFIKELRSSDWATKNKSEIDKLSQEYVNYVKAYNIIKPRLLDIINGKYDNQQNNNNTSDDQTTKDEIQAAANSPQPQPQNNQQAGSASVVTEAMQSSTAKQTLLTLLNSPKDSNALNTLKQIIGFNGDDNLVINSILQFRRENPKIIQKLSQAKATVTTGDADGLPSRLYRNAMRRKIENYI